MEVFQTRLLLIFAAIFSKSATTLPLLFSPHYIKKLLYFTVAETVPFPTSSVVCAIPSHHISQIQFAFAMLLNTTPFQTGIFFLPFLGELLPINERQTVFQNGTLLIKKVSKVDSGNYSCSVRQGNWVAKQDVTVLVRGEYFKDQLSFLFKNSFMSFLSVPPKIEPFSFPSKLQEGGRTRVTCTALVGDLPLR